MPVCVLPGRKPEDKFSHDEAQLDIFGPGENQIYSFVSELLPDQIRRYFVAAHRVSTLF